MKYTKSKEERRNWFYSLTEEERENWIMKKRMAKKGGVSEMVMGTTNRADFSLQERAENILPWD